MTATTNSFRPPMLCQEIKETILDSYIQGGAWIGQDKIDGIRAILYVQNDGSVVVQGRRNFITHRYPELQRAFSSGQNFVIDAEICTKDEVFNNLQYREMNNNPFKISVLSGLHPTKIMVFDILELDGKSLIDRPLIERLEILKKTVKENDSVHILKVYDKPSEIRERFDYARKNAKEGVVIKEKSQTYVYGKRSAYWLKCKTWMEAVVKVNAYEVNPAGITCSDGNGFRVLVAGKNSEIVKSLLDKNGSVDLEIQYLELTKTGAYRMPTFKRVV
jgi:ATP-dependent DNA ligase